MELVANDERRAQKRSGVRVPIALEWRPEQGIIRRTRGVTRDFSRRGLFCYVEEPIPEGQAIEFDVVFPVEMTAAAPIALHGRGLTRRTDARERRIGLAASIETHEPVALGDLGPDPERRVRQRVRPDCTVSVEYPGLRPEIRDLSTTGAFITDERPLPVGRTLDLKLQPDGSDSTIEVRAVVRRIEPQVGMAVEFTTLTEQAATLLQQMVEQRNLAPC